MFSTLLLALALSQPPQAPDIPQAPPTITSEEDAPPPKDAYRLAYDEAAKSKKPLVIFVNCPSRKSADFVSVQVPTLNGSDSPRIVAGRIPEGNKPIQGFSLLPEATDKEIVDAVAVRKVQPTAAPFRRLPLRRGEVLHSVEDDLTDPQLRDLLEDMEPYESTDIVQLTQRRVSGVISPSSRLSLENKWLVPGHLDGINGWSSRLYRKRGVQAVEFLVQQDPSDNVSAVTWSRSYPDTKFVEVARNANGELFEARVAEKKDGKWRRFVEVSNKEHQPAGYVKPTTNECRSCHAKAGRSEYGGQAIPGADTVFSERLRSADFSVQGGNRTSLSAPTASLNDGFSTGSTMMQSSPSRGGIIGRRR